jgi:hypothetical protein
MKTFRLATVLLITLVLVLVPLALSCNESASTPEGNLADFRAALEKDGFTVQEGKLAVIDFIKLYNEGLVTSCNANNANLPYLAYFLPARTGQALNSMLTDAPINPAHKGLWVTNRFSEDEALIYIGKTPPECQYFSYCNYLFHRYDPESGNYTKLFASTGDAVNQLTINTAGGEGNPFNQDTLVITTADKGIDQRIRDDAKSAGYSQDIMNTIPVPTAVVNMGLDKEADTIVMAIRTAYFADKQAGDDFISDPDAVVWRITPTQQTQPDPFPVPDLRLRGTGKTEMEYLPAVEELRQAILNEYSNYTAEEYTAYPWLHEGYVGIQDNTDLLGEVRDTAYTRTDAFTLDKDEFLIVYGVNHAATGKATYSNFGVYGEEILNGIGAVPNDKLLGTADDYIPENPQKDYLYVWKVARASSEGENCLLVPYGVKANGVDLDKKAFVGFRAYLEPETKVGPVWQELVLERVIKFSPRQ